MGTFISHRPSREVRLQASERANLCQVHNPESFCTRAMPLIRALMERVDELEADIEAINCLLRTTNWKDVPARIDTLEAERDIWKGRAQLPLSGPWPDPTPSDIAARVSERKARTP